MRWKALLVVGMLLVSGCISPGSGDDDSGTQAQSINASSSANQSVGNASENATYLKNTDYNETHVHDYWPGNATEKVLMDETVSTNTFVSAVYTVFYSAFVEPHPGVGFVYFSLPNGSFVPQGTGKLTVEVDATGALRNGQQSLSYLAANEDAFTEMDGQGAQATWEIDVAPSMADLPHAKSTEWAFLLDADGAGSVLEGEINVKITAHKMRDLEAWPEHPDFWDAGNLTKLDVANINGTYDEQETYVQEFAGDGDEGIPMPEGEIVPPETSVLLVKFWFARSDDAKNNLNEDVRLRVKEGSSSSYYSYQYWRMLEERPGYKMYAIPVDGSNWDSPYAEKSSWGFMIQLDSGVRDPSGTFNGISVGNTAEIGAGNYTIDATAYREAPPWLADAMEEENIGQGFQARS